MKKTWLALLLAAVLALGGVSAAFAAGELPFELAAPGNVSVVWLEGNDSPTTMQVAYTLTNEMTVFFQEMDEAAVNGTIEDFMKPYGFDGINITTQVDWAVDDVNDPVSGWHYTKYWDRNKTEYGYTSLGYDEDFHIRVSDWDAVDAWIGDWTETVNSHWLFRYVSEDAFNGNPDEGTPGLKDQLRPDQYEYRYTDGEGSLYMDFTEHTFYVRMRYVVTTNKDTEEGVQEQVYYSDWSNVAAVGKDAVKYEPLTAKDLAAPEITGLRMTDKTFNDCPVAAFTLTVPEKLATDLARVAAAGGSISIETYARVKGDEDWTEMANTDFNISAGERECALIALRNEEHPTIAADTEIELRCRYRCYQPEQEDVFSDYSEILTFNTTEISANPQSGSTEPQPGDALTPPEPAACPICHFCSQPLGLCIFIWLAILLAAIVVIVILARAGKKRKTR